MCVLSAIRLYERGSERSRGDTSSHCTVPHAPTASHSKLERILTRLRDHVHVCLEDETCLDYLCENVVHLQRENGRGVVTLSIIPEREADSKQTYIVEMKYQVQLADIFEGPVKTLHKHLYEKPRIQPLASDASAPQREENSIT